MTVNPFLRSILILTITLEQCFVVFILILSSGGFRIILSSGILKACFYGSYVITLLLIMGRWKRFLRAISLGDKLPLILVAIALLSILWSDVPNVTQLKARELLGITLFGAYFGTRYTLKEQFRLLAWTLGISAILSLFYALALRKYGVHPEALFDGAWRGIYLHKNILGTIMALSGVFFLLIARSKGKYNWFAWIGVALSFMLLIPAQSGGGRIVFFFLILLIPLYKALRFRYNLLIFFSIIIVLSGAVASTLFFDNVEFIFESLGKDPTLTGRVPIWNMMFKQLEFRPWLGYAYGGFWRGWEGPSAYIWRHSNWRPNYGHNGYIDLLLELGWIGFAVFVLAFLTNIRRAFMCIRLNKSVEGLFPLLYLTHLGLGNLTESRLLDPNSMFWLLFVSISLLPLTGRSSPSQSDPEAASTNYQLEG